MHEWIENFREYEAVLLCKNALQVFEKTVVLRAFQTFGWNDASTPGNDNSFVHEESGTIVRHEGALLAIECGHDRLTDALSDLVSVLHGLGWVSVEVYHAPETMKALLTDIGKAIPANMQNFDVMPAAVETAVSDFPESAALIKKGRAVMQMGGIDAANGTMLEELQSMDSQLIQRPASKEKQAIILLDDEPGDSETGALFVSLADAPAVAASTVPASGVRIDQESEEPAVFTLPMADAPVAQPAPIEASVAQPVRIQHHAAPVIASAPVIPVALKASENEEPATRLIVLEETPELQSSSEHSAEARTDSVKNAVVAAIDVGASTIVFDSPDRPISLETIEAMFAGRAPNVEGYYKEAVYVRPGSLGEKWRWDLLGELSVEKPWFAEKIVDAMGLDGPAAMLMSLVVTAARADDDSAQLRDILSAFVKGGDFKSRLGSAAHLAGQLENFCDVDAAMAQIVGALAPLLLCPAGLAFVDRHDRGEEPSLDGMFTMRGLLTSSDALLLVVQVDALDGRFAHWLADLMRIVATAYGASKVYEVVAQLAADQRNIENERHQVEAVRAELGAKVTAITGEYFDRLRDLGCDVPRLSGSHA